MSFKSSHYKNQDSYRKVNNKYKSSYRLKTGAFKWRRKWTPEEINKVLEHNIPDTELSKELNRSVNAIQRKRWEYKYTSKLDF